ncbi:cobyrinate a,c-diamide synthase [Acetivibrio cellulolyticus]|uniref:cobyrinate a,c-diamide synthase n=1 Tax=Acetivibrio cellulolyticus TaxID=35830 RepID=UPI0001E2E2F0|nr:cobyrinate a,c-diamide synthase [Acetivibrio cellulolyticus]
MSIRKVTIAGTNSGCGKTTVTMGILATLYVMGLDVQPFKVGPDYVDPMIHTFITGNDSRNLDSWMLDIDTVVHLFEKNAINADISIVEGTNGLYDGYDGNTIVGSTAHVAKIIKSPVILVVNAEGVSLSIVPMVRGFIDYDRNLEIIGVILNKVSSEEHYEALKTAIETGTGVKVFGYLPKMDEDELPCKHVGLVPEEDMNDLKKKIRVLVEQVIKTIDVDLIIKMSNRPRVSYLNATKFSFEQIKPPQKIKIAVAKDKAFSFYYKDNLELLKMMGAEIQYFSPLKDITLPEDIDGIYLGGGYPDFYAKELQGNKSFIQSIKKGIMAGIPTYAEFGGLMYLSQYVEKQNNEKANMAGILPGYCRTTQELSKSGYVDIEVTKNNVLSKKGYRIRGYEFCHSEINMLSDDVSRCFNVVKRRPDMEPIIWKCGYSIYNLIAVYPHLHLWGNTDFAKKFIESCNKYRMANSLAI